jgi:hypothetical protein
VRRLEAYLASISAGERPEAGRERLEGFRLDQERIMLGLRRSAGVVAGDAGSRLLASNDGRHLVNAGVIGPHGERIVVANPLLTDAAARAVLSLSPDDC